MTDIEITSDTLIIHVRGADKLFALRNTLAFPLAHVAGAMIDPGLAQAGPIGFRIGTHIPGLVAMGTFIGHEGKVFWDVVNSAQAIVIYLNDEDYIGAVVEVEQPEATRSAINAAVAAVRHQR